MPTHPRNLKLVGRAKSLRKTQTDTENKLWYHLRDRRFLKLKFRRQYPIKSYIVDFICIDKMLIIEVDGGQHAENKNDLIRDKCLKAEGYEILRFWNNDVLENTEGVLKMIELAAANPHPAPLPEREREKGDEFPIREGGKEQEFPEKEREKVVEI